MTKEELIHKINDLEWEDFEAKEAKSELPKNIWETVSAFANTSGGWIVLGIKQIGKKFEVCDVDNIEKLEQDFLGTLRGQKFNIKLSASAYKYDLDGKKVLAFHVPSSSVKPIYYNNPTIAKLFRFANISENVGFGMGKLFSWKEITGNDVTFESNRNIVSICFHLHNNQNNPTSNTKDTPSIADIKTQQERLAIKLGIKLGDYHSVNIESNKKSILLLVIFYPRITRTDIAHVLDITVSTLDYHLRLLRKAKLLERVGADKNGYWQVNI